jgi:hypothetical protein
MRLMIRNAAVDTDAATRRISSFFRHRIPKYSNRPRGLKIAITKSTTPSKLQLVACRRRRQNRPNKSRINGSNSIQMN